MEKVHRIVEEHAEALWATGTELGSLHAFLELERDDDSDDDESTIAGWVRLPSETPLLGSLTLNSA